MTQSCNGALFRRSSSSYSVSAADGRCLPLCGTYTHTTNRLHGEALAHIAHLERPFPYLVGVGLVLRLHSVRSRAISWVTPTAVMSSFSCWFHVFLGRPRRLVPGMARFITLRVTLSASRLWTCPNQRRRPQRITSSIGEMCRMRRISSFLMWSRLDTPRIPRSILISVVAIFLLLVTFIAQHSLPYVRAGLIMASYTFAFSRRGIFRSYNTPVNFLQLDQAACTRRSTSLSMVPSLSITDPRYLKWSSSDPRKGNARSSAANMHHTPCRAIGQQHS